jgi:hypothetical protein
MGKMKIVFKAFSEFAGVTQEQPKPAVKTLPAWFNAIPRFVDDAKKFKFFSNGNGNSTIKWCNPFMDSLTAGYTLTLEQDLFVQLESGEHLFSWKSGGDGLISTHDKKQVSAAMVPQGFDPQPFKFRNDWAIQTPKGYSALFVHPLNRGDLPFYTLSGFVETDDYHMPVNFPFLIRADFEGIIPAGTPVAQVIPIKRESWTHEVAEYDPKFVKEKSSKLNSTIYRAYKNLFWKRKDYR